MVKIPGIAALVPIACIVGACVPPPVALSPAPASPQHAIALPATWTTTPPSTPNSAAPATIPTSAPALGIDMSVLGEFTPGDYLVFSEISRDSPEAQHLLALSVPGLTVSAPFGTVGDAAVAPSGRRLLWRGDNEWRISDLDARATTPLALEPGQRSRSNAALHALSWSHDETAIAFSYDETGLVGEASLWLGDLSTMTLRPIPGGTGCDWASLSPDGLSIAAGCIDQVTGFYQRGLTVILQANSGVRSLLPTLRDKFAYRQQWSPSGKYIAMVLTEGRSGELPASDGVYLLPASCIAVDPPCPERPIGPLAWSELYAWSPDGAKIAIADHEYGVGIYDAVNHREIVQIPSPQGPSVSWSPGGQWLAITGNNEIRILETAAFTEVGRIALDNLWAVFGWLAFP